MTENIFADPGGNIDPVKAYQSFLKESIKSPGRRIKALSIASMGDSMGAELFTAQDEIVEIGKRIEELERVLKKMGYVLKGNMWKNEKIENALALDSEMVEIRKAAHRRSMEERGYRWDEKVNGWVETEELKAKHERVLETAFVQFVGSVK